MKTIYKYEIPAQNTLSKAHQIELPIGSVFLKAINQKEKLQLYFEVDDEKKPQTESFACFHTGSFLPANEMEYLDTVSFDDGDYILHIYKLI